MNDRTDEEILAALQEVEVPEPSPLFWDHLSHRVREAVAEEPLPAPGWTIRLGYGWGAGVVAVMAVAVLAVTITTRQTARGLGPASATGGVAHVSDVLPPIEPVALEPLENDASWAMIGDLASQMDWDEAGAEGLVVTPGAAEGVINELSRDEQRAVIELLQQDMKDGNRL